MLTGQAKTDYQREYMRKRRSNKPSEPVRPEPVNSVRPNVRPEQPTHKASSNLAPDGHPIQHTKPMMVGYVRLS